MADRAQRERIANDREVDELLEGVVGLGARSATSATRSRPAERVRRGSAPRSRAARTCARRRPRPLRLETSARSASSTECPSRRTGHGVATGAARPIAVQAGYSALELCPFAAPKAHRWSSGGCSEKKARGQRRGLGADRRTGWTARALSPPKANTEPTVTSERIASMPVAPHSPALSDATGVGEAGSH